MMTGQALFWNRMAKGYARRPIADEAAYEKKLAITRGYLRPDMTVLELGCGTGGTARRHASHVKQYRATDISSKMIAIAREKATAENIDNVTFEEAEFDDVTVADETLDAVLALNILHLLDDRDRAISRVHKMLKPGGIFVSSTPCVGDLPAVLKFILNLVGPVGRPLGLFPLLRFFTPAELKASLEDAGFALDHCWQPGEKAGLFIVAIKSTARQ